MVTAFKPVRTLFRAPPPTFSNTFSWMKIVEFRLNCHCCLFQWSSWQYAIIDLDTDLAPSRRQVMILTSDGLLYWRINASLGLNELNPIVNRNRLFVGNISFFWRSNWRLVNSYSIKNNKKHCLDYYRDVIKVMASQIIGNSTVCSTLYHYTVNLVDQDTDIHLRLSKVITMTWIDRVYV